MIPCMVGKLAPNPIHFIGELVKYVLRRDYFRAVPSQNGDKFVTSPPPPLERRGWHYIKLSLSSALFLYFSGICIFLLFLSFCRFFICFLLCFFCSRWRFEDVPLIFFCPADHVPNWQPRILLGMVEARSVNVKITTTTTTTNSPIFSVEKFQYGNSLVKRTDTRNHHLMTNILARVV